MLTWVVLALAGFGAGVVNAVAGGGSLISFPALLQAGMGARIANATNTVAIWPGSVSAVIAYRGVLAGEKHRARVLAWPSLAGGLAGSWLLLHTSERLFRGIVPWLMFLSCALLAAQVPVARWVSERTRTAGDRVPAGLVAVQFVISVYGGYFGAGMGILMLAAMAIFVPHGLQAANALKVLFALLINGIAAVYFSVSGAVRWQEAALMAVTSILGGFVGVRLAQRMPARPMRLLVIAFGMIVAFAMLLG